MATDNTQAGNLQLTVKPAPGSNRFEVYYGDDLAGFAEYLDHGGQRIFHHTEIGAQFGGKGLGSKLIESALTQTAQAGLRIVPVCPFVRKFLDKHDTAKHDDFASAVDPVTPDLQALVPAAD